MSNTEIDSKILSPKSILNAYLSIDMHMLICYEGLYHLSLNDMRDSSV